MKEGIPLPLYKNESKLNEGKEIFKKGKRTLIRRKKEICIGAVGVLLLGGVGFGVSSMANTEANTATTKVATEGKGSEDTAKATKEDKKANKKEDSKKGTEVTTVKEDGSKEVTTIKEDVTKEVTTVKKDGTTEVAIIKEDSPNGGNSTSSEKSSSSGNTSTGGGSTSSGSSTGESSSTGGSSQSGGGSNPTTPVHTHSWTPTTTTVHHDEVGHWDTVVVKDAWTEEVPVYETDEREICNACNADISGTNIGDHLKRHMMAGERGGFRTEWRNVQTGTNTVNHPAVTEKKYVVDKAAWNETVTTGHKCSCGASK